MPATKITERLEPMRHDAAAAVLMEGINTFSQAASSQRKRKRGVSSIPRSGGEAIGARLDVKDLDMIAGNSRLRNSLKGLVDDANIEAPSVSNHQKLSAPAPHATQVRLNRQEAYSTTKQILNKWTEAVKSARSAEQLIFPLEGNAAGPSNNRNSHSSHQSGRTAIRPSTKLENRISQTLSLATQGPEKDKSGTDSGNLTKSRSKHTKAKTAHLRMERELLLRKEAKAKRLRKIKSKSYRRLLRKDQRKFAEQPLSSDDANVDETEGALEGGRDLSQPDNGSPGIEQKYENIDENTTLKLRSNRSLPGQRLFAMKFMEAEKSNANKGQILGAPENQGNPQGRRIFHDGLLVGRAGQAEAAPITNKKSTLSSNPKIGSHMDPKPGQIEDKTNPWLCPQPTKENGELEASLSLALVPQKDDHRTSILARDRNDTHTTAVILTSSSSSGDTPGAILTSPTSQTPIEPSADVTRNEQPGLLARAFAGDNILPEVSDQQPKHSSPPDRGASGLQGWGAWGISLGCAGRSRKQTRTGRQKTENHQTRVEKVVLNQQLCKKGAKYLATTLPYPFETSDQYERSLRFPIGQEWSTKQTHQTLTAPKVIVKGGTVVAPLS